MYATLLIPGFIGLAVFGILAVMARHGREKYRRADNAVRVGGAIAVLYSTWTAVSDLPFAPAGVIIGPAALTFAYWLLKGVRTPRGENQPSE